MSTYSAVLLQLWHPASQTESSVLCKSHIISLLGAPACSHCLLQAPGLGRSGRSLCLWKEVADVSAL